MPAVVAATPPIIAAAGTASTALAAVGPLAIQAGIGFVLHGIGSLLGGSGRNVAPKGVEISSVNPISPWQVVYGRKRVGGTMIFINEWGLASKYLDLVIVIAAHECQSVDALYFNNRKILLDNNHTSFTPTASTANISAISRVGTEVTVTLVGDIANLDDGDTVVITAAPVTDMNGTFPVQIVGRPGGNLTFKYYAGGLPYSGGPGSAKAQSNWVDYGAKVYCEFMLGTQTLGQTFAGMTTGSFNDLGGSANPPNLIQPGVHVVNSNNPWTTNCSVLGKTCAFIRLHYDSGYFASGLPNISFKVHGKNDILDPRTSTRGYTENAALCIADYLQVSPWGFKAGSTEVNSAQLIAAANICDESVSLNGGGTEPRYTCNGSFTLDMSRGEILQNLLTSCAGRLTYTGGQFYVWPGAWFGSSGSVTHYGQPVTALTGSTVFQIASDTFRWRPSVSVTDLYNGVKGTYLSPVGNWTATDFPAYAQDTLHGYSSDANLTADGGDRRWLDVQLPFTASASMAQRIAKIELLRRRQQGTGTFSLNMTGYQFAPLDVIQMDLSTFGWTGKYLEIGGARLKFSGSETEPVLIGTEIDVQETDPSVYAWSTTEELSAAGTAQAQLPDLQSPGPPTNVVLSNAPGGITITWTAPADAYVLDGGHIEIEYQIVASPEGLWFSLAKMDPSATTATISNLIQGDSYNVRIRSVNVAGVAGAWVIGTPVGGVSPGPITVRGPLPINAGWLLPIGSDPIFSESNFGISQGYTLAEDGTPLPQISVFGYPPVNVFSTTTTAPTITGITVGTGGSITGGKTYVVAVTAFDGTNPGTAGISPLSNFFTISAPSGSGKTLQVSVDWPAGSFGGAFWVASPDDSRGFHFEGNTADAFTSTSGTVVETLSAVAGIGGGPPDDEFDHCVFKVMRELVSGIFAQEAASIGTNSISFGGSGGSTNQFVGRVLSKIAHQIEAASANPVPELPIQDFLVTANDTSGNFTVTPDPAAVGCQVGDLFTMRTAPTAADATSFTDSLFNNLYNPGLKVNGNAGNLVFVLAGTGAFQTVQTVVDNTSTKVTVSPGWDVIPDSTSVIVIVESAAQVNVPGGQVQLPEASGWLGPLGTLPIPNYAGEVVRVELYSADATGVTGPQQTVPSREVYVWGAGGTREVFADTTQLITDGTIACDTTAAAINVQCLPKAQAPNVKLVIEKVSSDVNNVSVKAASTAAGYPQDEAFQDGSTVQTLVSQGDAILVVIKG